MVPNATSQIMLRKGNTPLHVPYLNDNLPQLELNNVNGSNLVWERLFMQKRSLDLTCLRGVTMVILAMYVHFAKNNGNALVYILHGVNITMLTI
jgi:hypothetical protein